MQDLQLLGATASFNKTMLRKVGAFQVPYGIMIRVSHLNNAPIHLRSSYQFWSVPYPTLPLEPRTSLRHRSRSWRAPDTCSKSENTQQRKNYDDIFIWWLWLNNLYIHINILMHVAIFCCRRCYSYDDYDSLLSFNVTPRLVPRGIPWCWAWPLHHLLNAESGIGLEQGHPPCYEFIAGGRCQ